MEIKPIASCTPCEILHIQSEYERLSFCIEHILGYIIRFRKPEAREIEFSKFIIRNGEVMVLYSYRVNVYGSFIKDTLYFPIDYLHMKDAAIKDKELAAVKSNSYLRKRFEDVKTEYDNLKKIFT